MQKTTLFCIAALPFFSKSTLALECPKMPEQANSNWTAEVDAAVLKIGPVKGAELVTRARSTTSDLLGKLPNANGIYLEQMMYASYCSALRDNKTISETEKASLLRTYNKEVRETINRQTPASSESKTSISKKKRIKPIDSQKPLESQSQPKESLEVKSPDTQLPVSSVTVVSVAPEDKSTNQPSMEISENSTMADLAPTVLIKGIAYNVQTGKQESWQITPSWKDIFSVIAPYLVGRPWESDMRHRVVRQLIRPAAPNLNLESIDIDEYDFQTISIKLRALGLMKIELDGRSQIWVETPLGQKRMYEIRAAQPE